MTRDTDYLFLAARVRALEAMMLTRERQERMLEAPSLPDAVRVLEECGWTGGAIADAEELHAALTEQSRRTLADVAAFSPDPDIVAAFRLRYDYHNVKVLLRAEAQGAEAAWLLSGLGRISEAELRNAIRTSDLHALPRGLQEAIAEGREVLGATRDPQLADFALDRAHYRELLASAKRCGSRFLTGYARAGIDAANLRGVVRALRMGKGQAFLKGVLLPGGTVDALRILRAVASGSSLEDLYGPTPLSAAAAAGAAAIAGGRLTRFERLCDDAMLDLLRRARFVPFGDAPVIAYLAARERELTAVRIILTGRLAGLGPDTIRERLRESYA